MGMIKFNQIENLAENQQFLQALQRSLEETGRFQTYDVVVLSPHASYIEYGTNGATKKSAEVDAYGQSVKDVIDRWVILKFGTQFNKKQRREFSYSVYKKIMQKGITAKPYIRPAIQNIMDNTELLNDVFATSNEPLKDIAILISDEMKDIVRFNDSIFTHELIDSIKVVKGAEGRITDDGTSSNNNNNGDAGGK